MCRSVYSYILPIHHYAPTTFSAISNLPNSQILAKILANNICENQFSRLRVNLCENTQECIQIFGIRLFPENWRMCGSGFTIVRLLKAECSKQKIFSLPCPHKITQHFVEHTKQCYQETWDVTDHWRQGQPHTACMKKMVQVVKSLL